MNYFMNDSSDKTWMRERVQMEKLIVLVGLIVLAVALLMGW